MQFNGNNISELSEFTGKEVTMGTEVRNCSDKHPEGFDYPTAVIATENGDVNVSLNQSVFKTDSRFKEYKRKSISEMRLYEPGEDLSKISVSGTDDPETDLGYVARNPKNHADQWYVAKQYFEDNLEAI